MFKYAVAAMASLSLCGGAAMAQDSPDPIRMVLNDWTGQLLSTQLMGEALKRKGYSIDYVQADAMAQFVGLQSGDLDVQMEVWATTQKTLLDQAVATGNVENLGESGMKAKEEWWYPLYMKEKCPGLPDWKALLEPACVKAFSTAETAPKGRYLGAPVTWGGFDDERVAALGLDFEVIHAGTDAALFAELASAYQRKASIILWVYTPHWVPSIYQGEYIQFPPYTDDCYKTERYDCAKPSGPIWKVAWAGAIKKWPGAIAAIKKFSISNEEMNALIKRVDIEKEPLKKVVSGWLDANERWQEWFK
ncbi:ABC transporter substrate-binding protein [Mesorhizobium sp. M0204]|uniref:ABC transporter substrate-binding protein n=1 Tax=Mesorhizobium sp. M0204 TaxID=2956913 RepID=UPI0033366F37